MEINGSIRYFDEILRIARDNGYEDDLHLCDSCKKRRYSCTNGECLSELKRRFKKGSGEAEQLSLFGLQEEYIND